MKTIWILFRKLLAEMELDKLPVKKTSFVPLAGKLAGVRVNDKSARAIAASKKNKLKMIWRICQWPMANKMALLMA